jgi:glycosyltransferase involved in cell wall biosynthesis
MNDLCATTQIALATGLCKRGYNLTFVNSDTQGSHDNWPWNHQSIPNNVPRGFRSRALGKKMRKWFSSKPTEDESVALVDWRIASELVPLFQERKMAWILIDRSPPADRGLLSFLQWPSWKRSWNNVEEDEKALGCVVSKAHQTFVALKTRVNPDSIVELPAGVDLDLFQPNKRFEQFTLVYHGRLDRHRGVMALPMLLHKAQIQGIEARLILIGEGNAFQGLSEIAKQNSSIEVKPTVSKEILAEIISKCHVGLLPMPKQKVWTISSPLKRSEYAACGLLIYGINHSGHQFAGKKALEWIKLVDQEDFHDAGTAWFADLLERDLEPLRQQARTFAKENLSWENTLDALENAVLSLVQ